MRTEPKFSQGVKLKDSSAACLVCVKTCNSPTFFYDVHRHTHTLFLSLSLSLLLLLSHSFSFHSLPHSFVGLLSSLCLSLLCVVGKSSMLFKSACVCLHCKHSLSLSLPQKESSGWVNVLFGVFVCLFCLFVYHSVTPGGTETLTLIHDTSFKI